MCREELQDQIYLTPDGEVKKKKTPDSTEYVRRSAYNTVLGLYELADKRADSLSAENARLKAELDEVRVQVKDIHYRLNEILTKHRKESYLTCPESCWCWDLETVIILIDETAHKGKEADDE